MHYDLLAGLQMMSIVLREYLLTALLALAHLSLVELPGTLGFSKVNQLHFEARLEAHRAYLT